MKVCRILQNWTCYKNDYKECKENRLDKIESKKKHEKRNEIEIVEKKRK